jgi:hypothetical protein
METTKEPDWLAKHAADTYSQNGEDGVIAKILSLLPNADRWCVEFGAWDGVHLSNVRKLILENGYRAIMIEGDDKRFQLLRKNYAGNDQVQPVNAFVGAKEGLDAILSLYGVPRNFDFLSIDIDGNDYYAWEAVREYRPKVVCVEFNPTIPSEVYFVQEREPPMSQGCSLLALDELARAKGYQLVCVLPWNAFFVDDRYFAAFEIADNNPLVMRKDRSLITWFFVGYDGSVHLAGAKRMPWHGISIDVRKVQVLPRILRSYPDNYTGIQKLFFRLLKAFSS